MISELNFNARVMLKRDTSSNWTSYNPVIKNGEIVLVDTSSGGLRAKIGDGEKKYTELPFSDEVIRNLIETRVTELTELISELDKSIDTRISESIDPSLTVSGVAADAKVTGDAISNLESKIFIGTADEYTAAYAGGSIRIGSIVIITDESVGDIPSVKPDDTNTSAALGVAILGQMILQ